MIVGILGRESINYFHFITFNIILSISFLSPLKAVNFPIISKFLKSCSGHRMYSWFIFPALMGANSCKYPHSCLSFILKINHCCQSQLNIKESYFLFAVFKKYFTENSRPLYLKCSSEPYVFSISFMVFVLR